MRGSLLRIAPEDSFNGKRDKKNEGIVRRVPREDSENTALLHIPAV